MRCARIAEKAGLDFDMPGRQNHAGRQWFYDTGGGMGLQLQAAE